MAGEKEATTMSVREMRELLGLECVSKSIKSNVS